VEAELYCFWAPQATYLNLFDPIFMARAHPAAFAAQQRLFTGEEPDAPMLVADQLESDHIAIDRGRSPLLFERLAGDPRTYPVYSSFNVIAGIRPAPAGTFFVDWRLALDDEVSPPAPLDGSRPMTPYLSFILPEHRPLVGYIDLGQVTRKPACATFVHSLDVAAPESARWEFAPWGPARISLDGTPLADVRSSRRAVLGRGLTIPVELAAGRHTITVETCSDSKLRGGFYLVRRAMGDRR
jgi:hypothetical protein